MQYQLDELTKWLMPVGRTLMEEKHGWFFNWSCSGFRLRFRGKWLLCKLEALEDACFPGERDNLPVLAVYTDGAAEPSRVIRLSRGKDVYMLFEDEEEGEHTIALLKRSENSKGRNALVWLETDGMLLRLPEAAPARRKLEFIGDSITCGFGMDMDPKADVFSTSQEDGMASYAGVAARLLDADFNSLCVSGIPLCWSPDPDYRLCLPDEPDFEAPKRAMEDYYAYVDRHHEETSGKADGYTRWDFASFRPDAIIVNLGTNDALRVTLSTGEAEERYFFKRYLAFLYALRQLNGVEPIIVCTLGSMDYYLYDVIVRAVCAYRTETSDRRVYCMKFRPINEWGGEMGGLGHPSRLAQERMGCELAQRLKPLLEGDMRE